MVGTRKTLFYPSSSICAKMICSTTPIPIVCMMSLIVWATTDIYYYTSAFSSTRYPSHPSSTGRFGNASSRYSSISSSISSDIDNNLKESASTTAVPVKPAKVQQEFDIDSMTTLGELNELSISIGGPVLLFDDDENDNNNDNDDTIIEDAKDRLWDYVEGTAEEDIDKMCMGQLTGLLVELLGKDTMMDVEDYFVNHNISTLEEVRNLAWDLSSLSSAQ